MKILSWCGFFVCLMVVVPFAFAEQGPLAQELRREVDHSKIALNDNFTSFTKAKEEKYLDQNHSIIQQLFQNIQAYYANALEVSQKLYPNGSKRERLMAEMDSTEIKLIGFTETPPLCDQLYTVAQNYIDIGNKKKAKQALREIVIDFVGTSYASCNKKAEFALEDLRESK